MSPMVCSLGLAKRLSVLMPKAETEYIWINKKIVAGGDDHWIIDLFIKYSPRDLKLFEWFPAWQIHELLDAFPKYDGIHIEKNDSLMGKEYHVWYDDGDTYKDYYDVRLVDALARLMIWRLENEC